jgi:hypothetical protein
MSNESHATPEKTPLSRSRVYRQNRKGGRSDTPVEALRIWLFRLRSCLSDMSWNVQTVRAELRSFSNRICVLRDKNNHRAALLKHVQLGPQYEEDGPTGRLQLCRETFARNESIERMLAKYPWASGSDVVLFLYGWEMGREFSLDNACNRSREMGQTSAASVSKSFDQ